MIGNLLILALTSFVGVSCAVPLMDQSQVNQNEVNYSLPYFPTDYFVSDSSGVSCNFQHFKGLANIAVNGVVFDDVVAEDEYFIYGLTSTEMVVITSQSAVPYAYDEICAYLESSIYYGGFVVYYNDNLDGYTITPYWKPYSLNGVYNYSFWGFVQETNLNDLTYVRLTSGSNFVDVYADEQFSWDAPINMFSHQLMPFLYCGNVSIEVGFSSPSTFDKSTFIFCMGAREDNSINQYQLGYDTGYNTGFTNGETNGYQNGYTTGYNTGLSDGLNMAQTSNFNSLFNAIADTPVVFMRSLFGFELFGMNVFAIIMSLITGLIVIYVIKKVWK